MASISSTHDCNRNVNLNDKYYFDNNNYYDVHEITCLQAAPVASDRPQCL